MDGALSGIVTFASAATEVDGDASRQVALIAVAIGLQVISVIVVCARLFARMFITQMSGADDWLILAAALVSIAFTVMVGLAAAAGVGMHANALTHDQHLRIDNAAWYSSMLNSIGTMLVRSSLLVFFLRLFPSRGVRIVSIVLLVASTTYGVGSFFVIVFQCVPFGVIAVDHCINFALFYRSIAIIAMVLDFAILLTPIPSLYNVHLHWRARLSVILVFAIAFVPCIASAFRVYLATNTDRDRTDFTYRLGLQLIWIVAELNMAIICACVAGLKPLFTRYLPGIFGSSWPTSDGLPPTSGLASYPRRTGAFSHGGHVSRTDPVELRNLGGAAGGNGEVFSVQITTSTKTFMDGNTSLVTVSKVEGDDSSRHERDTKV